MKWWWKFAYLNLTALHNLTVLNKLEICVRFQVKIDMQGVTLSGQISDIT